MFCSEACRDEANRIYHEDECQKISDRIDAKLLYRRVALEILESLGGRFEMLEELMSDSVSKTVFDVDFSDPSKTNEGLLLAVSSLTATKVINSSGMICSTDKRLEDFIEKIMGILMNNSFELLYRLFNKYDELEYRKFGSGLFPFASLFNHSCAPNLTRVFVKDRMAFIVQRPIQKNSQLFICYR